MGILRLLLAIIVLMAHLPGGAYRYSPIDARQAVEVFFIVSGFYMALILNEKYHGKGSYGVFLGNRFLRLFPVYWAVLLLASAGWAVRHGLGGSAGPLRMLKELHGGSRIAMILANLLIIGQDAVMFTQMTGGHLTFTSNFRAAAYPAWGFLIDPPAWSLALELTFYLIAPFLVRRSAGFLVSVIVAALSLRAWIYFGLGLQHDPWTYRFFPTELALFLGGALAYRAYAALRRRPAWPARGAWGAALVAAIAIAAYRFLPPFGTPETPALKQWGLFLVLGGTLPWLFALSRSCRRDRALGELAYPIYICQWPVIALLSPPTARFHLPAAVVDGVIIAVVVLFSIALLHFVAAPIEAIRERRAGRLKPREAESAEATLIEASTSDSPPPL